MGLKLRIIALVVFVVLLAACTSAPASTPTVTQSPPQTVATAPTSTVGPTPTLSPGSPAVVGIVDGDTIDVRIDGRSERVRLIGVDTPEVYGGTDCFGSESSAFTKSLLPPGAPVALEKDVSERDRYDRLLRYVYLPDGRMLNEVLVAEGYARVATFPPDVKYLNRFLVAQAKAKEVGRGLWSSCALGQTTTPPTSTAAPAQVSTPAAGASCDPSYPTVCIPPPPPDLDCKDITYRRFKVLQPDPHRFDTDKDGIGCES